MKEKVTQEEVKEWMSAHKVLVGLIIVGAVFIGVLIGMADDTPQENKPNKISEYVKTYVPCEGTNYGNDMAAYQQTNLCTTACRNQGLNLYNTHCFDYLACTCRNY